MAALEQAGVDVEDVPGEGLPTGGAPEEKGELTIRASVLREVVVDDQHIASRLHEMLRDAGRGVRSDIGEARRVVALCHDDDGVVHRPLLPQHRHDLCDGGGALADGAVDAQHVLSALVQDGVDRDGGLACLAVTQNQLPLAAPDGNERVDDLHSCLERHGDRCAVHDVRSRAFDGQTLTGNHRPFTVERPTERIEHASHQCVAHRHVHDPARALDFVARVQTPVVAQQDDSDLVLVDIEGDAEGATRERDQLLEPHARKTGHMRDARRDAGDRTHLSQGQARREGAADLGELTERVVENALQAIGCRAHRFLAPRSGPSDLCTDVASALGSGPDFAASGLGAGFPSRSGWAFASAPSFSFKSSCIPFSSDAR